MPNHLSTLGIIHTAISIIAILTAFYALYREGKINPSDSPGKLYILLTILACLTALPIMKTGHPTGGHYLAVLILVLLPIGIYAGRLRILGNLREYVQVIVMSATLFFSLIPAVIETLTRLPESGPIATGPNDPVVLKGLLVLAILFIAGSLYQVIKLGRQKKTV